MKLSLIAVVPVVVSVILHYLFKIPSLNRINYWVKQTIIGIVFGLIAIMGTEFGVSVAGATLNARDAAPLCAAMIFGGPSGIIAGFIGGIERWFAVYWGAGTYTRLACSISTCIVGIFGAVLKKYMFNNKIPNAIYALEVGIVGETIHMLMVFVTNINDAVNAFAVVKACTVPLITINSTAVALAVFVLKAIERKETHKKRSKTVAISEQIQKGLVALLILAFAITSQFMFSVQDGIAKSDSLTTLTSNLEDVKAEIDANSNANLLEITGKIKNEVIEKGYDDETLLKLSKKYSVTEINYVNSDGIIEYSTISDFIGYDMTSGAQSNEFMCLVDGEVTEYVQPYQQISYDLATYRKYAGASLEEGFIQVGYSADEFQWDLASKVVNSATHRHIGETGGMLVANQQGIIDSSSNGKTGTLLEFAVKGISKDIKENTLYKMEMDGEEYYYSLIRPEGYTIVAFIGTNEANVSRDLTTYMNVFMEVVIFACLFILIYFMLDRLVVRNFKKVNGLLNDITGGNLDTVINVKPNEEFTDLSNGINTTVNAMKEWIDEANRRIDNELAYAKDIQFASLPTVFPAFPERSEFDIYASMNPAKEVGGDFYDFYIINGTTLVFLVADVSGKGIPAALFMMKAKSIIKTYAEGGIAVADILTNANFNLCEGNDAGMFVTCFIAFLDLKTGELKYSNAGHNKPLIKKKDGKYEYLKCKNGFILGGMEGVVYKEESLMMEPGDEIFLYTDGVVEATNADKELYGDPRLENTLNIMSYEDCETMCKKLKEDVDEFYVGCPQFDDITMLSVKFKKYFKF